jgi:GNAT superfamily N-acetyltransferase
MSTSPLPTELETSLIIRRATSDDAPAIAELSSQLGYAATADDIRQRLLALESRHTEQAVFVACVAAEVVGWVDVALTFHLQSPAYALIGGLMVKDGYRGLRIGRRLCEAAEDWSCALGIQVIRVTSRSTRLDAHRFYLRDGYSEVKTSRVFEKIL